MDKVVGVRFKEGARLYDPDGLELKVGDFVIVDSEDGPGLGTVVREAYKTETAHPLRKVLRKASEEDIKRLEENKMLEKESLGFCQNKIKEKGLPMKLVGTEFSFDRDRAIFYFTSEGRVDFRELVKDLAAKLKSRIEMRQIGVRDEARLVGGYGCCGRPLCCATFLKDFEPVSIRMAKRQELVLNPAKISGICGRLMCCLSFEYEIYDEGKKEVAKVQGKTQEPSEIEYITKVEGLITDHLNSKEAKINSLSIGTPQKVKVEPKMSIWKRRRGRKRRQEGEDQRN